MKIYPLVKPVKTTAAILAAAGDPEWGVDKIGADEVWAEGIIGSGIVVGSIDTGVDFSHPALVGNYRGNNHDGTFTHDYNWWDPSNSCPGEPCDNVGHGTHTMGTIAGGDGPGPFTPDTGVAPGAEWMTAKGCEDLGCTSESLLSSGQFMLAPTDLERQQPGSVPCAGRREQLVGQRRPERHVLPRHRPGVARGRDHPGLRCRQRRDRAAARAGTPGNFDEVISLGATDNNDQIADFSSRGPSPTGKVSPNVSAPGVDVISSIPGGGYAAFSGTSMATPHAAGTIALMLSAKTALIGDFDGVLNALDITAIDRPDANAARPIRATTTRTIVYGEGRIDAKAAVDLVKTGGTLSGTVTDASTTDPIAGARVAANNGDRDFVTTTDASGDYSIFLAAGTYAVTGKRVRLRLVDHPRRHRRHRRDDRPGHRPRRAAAVPRHGPRDRVRGRLADRGRQRRRHRDARPAGDDQCRRGLRPRPAGRQLHAARLGRRLHRGRDGRRDPRRRRHRPGLQPVPEARRLRPRLPGDRRSTGSTRPVQTASTATSSPGACGCRSPSASTARATRRCSSPTTAT